MEDGAMEAIDGMIKGHGCFHLIVLRFVGEDLPKIETLAKTNAMCALFLQKG